MKTIIKILFVIIGILFLANNSYSQNEPEMRKFKIAAYQDSCYLDTASYFKQDHFIIGSMHDAGMNLNRIFLANHQPILDMTFRFGALTDASNRAVISTLELSKKIHNFNTNIIPEIDLQNILFNIK